MMYLNKNQDGPKCLSVLGTSIIIIDTKKMAEARYQFLTLRFDNDSPFLSKYEMSHIFALILNMCKLVRHSVSNQPLFPTRL